MISRIALGIVLAAATACSQGSVFGEKTTGSGGTASSTTSGTTTGGQGTDSTTGGSATTTTGATVTTTTVGDANGMLFDVFIFAQYNTCIIGDICTGGATCNTSIKFGAASGVQLADNTNLRIVANGDPSIARASFSRCITPIMTQSAQDAVVQTLSNDLLQQIKADTGSTLPVTFQMHTVTLDTNTGVSFSYPSSTPRQNWFMDAVDVRGIITPYLTKKTSFVLVTGSMRDDAADASIVPMCMNTDTGDIIAGAGYSWVAKTADGFSSDCFTLNNAQYAWEQQLAWGINHVSGFSSIYASGYTGGCNTTNNPNKWFPNPFDCQLDPDWSDCGNTSASCGGPFFDHVLSAHWVAGRAAFTNHCQNGMTDYGETSVDTGGDCPAN